MNFLSPSTYLQRTSHIRWTLAAMLGVSSFLYFWANYCGLGFTFDSFHYIDIANHITLNGFLNNEGFNFRPPTYPVVVWLVGEKNIIWLNLVCLWVSITVIYGFSKEILNLTLRRSYCLLICLATPIYLTHSFVWTEPLFTSFLLLAFYGLHKFFQLGRSQWLIVSLLAFLLLPSIRIAGTFITLPIFFWLILNLKDQNRVIVTSYIIMLFGFFFIWIINFNSILSQGSSLLSLDQFLGQLTQNLDSFLDGFSLWFVPHPVPFFLRITAGIFVLSFFGILCIRKLLKEPLAIDGIIATSFILYYFALHPYFQVTFYTAERYLAPMFALVFLTLFKWTDDHFSHFKPWAKKVTQVVLVFQCIYGGLRVSNNLSLWSEFRCSENYRKVLESAETDYEMRYSEIKKETFSSP